MLRVAAGVLTLASLAANTIVLGANQRSGFQALTSCGAVSRLTPAEADQAPSVHLRVVVTYFDPNERNMFVQDETGGIYVSWDAGRPTPAVGDLIAVDGVAALADFAPQVNHPHWKLLAKSTLPAAKKVTYQQMVSTSEDSRLVEVEGVVRQVAHMHRDALENNLWMRVAIDGGEIELYSPWHSDFPRDLVDARVRIQGVAGANFNAKNQQIGVQLYVPSLRQITVVAEPNPAEPAPVPIDQLQRFGSRYSLGHRVKVAGTVTAAIPGRGFYLQDASSSLDVLTRQEIALVPGDRVETVGFVDLFESHVRLADAWAKVLRKGEPPSPVAISLEQALTGAFDSQLVTLEGRVIRSSYWRQRPTLTLQQKQNIFSISPIPGVNMGDLPADGSLLKVTGVLTDEIDSMDAVVSVNLLCRSAGDITISRPAPWWTMKKALAMVGIVTAVAALILLWVGILRRRVNHQTEVIRQKLLQEESLKEAAQAANRAKSEFLANMSHEIRTPMNAVLGFTDLLSETPLSEEQRDFTNTLRLSSHSLMRILNEILDFSKIEAGQLLLEETPFSITESVRHTFQLIVPEAHLKRLETAIRIEPGVWDSVVGDSHRLQQVILNLLSNGVKFTKSGSVELHVKSIEHNADDTLLQFTVTDTGIGIPVESQQEIFEAFQQADGSTTRKYGGTGLGLAICSRLVALMGGEIWVESVPSAGSKFHFTVRFKIRTVESSAQGLTPDAELNVLSRN